MSTSLVARAPRTRCYKCGSTVLFSTCHHCGRVMCRDDSPTILDSTQTPISKEFADLGLEKWGAYHCADCAHVVKGRLHAVIIAGVALAIIGLLTTGASVGFGLALLLLGVSVAAGGYLIDQQRVTQTMQGRPPAPLIPHVDQIRVIETLRGRLTLDQDGEYSAPIELPQGEVSFTLTFSRSDRDRLDKYRRRYRLKPEEVVHFSAGYAILRGPVGLTFLDAEATGSVIPLVGRVNEHPFLSESESRTTGKWKIERRHQLGTSTEIDSLPIWITPSMVPESDQRTLELELQWTDLGSVDASLFIDNIETLEILVPFKWGNVESATGRASVGRREDATGEILRRIQWTQLAVDAAARRAGCVKLSVRFEDKIEMSDVVRGELKAVFRGALSGVQGIDLYHPLGARRVEKVSETVQTKVIATFDLSLNGIRYQDARVVPDRKRIEDAGKRETEDFIGVVPDHETVIDLTNEMSDQEYYVKRVIENPPRSGGRANVANRYWDIAGRRYEGVYPVDFHVILTGEEVFDGDIRAQAGNTKVRITVWGAYATTEMEERIEKEWERLRELTLATLQRRPRAEPVEFAGHDDQRGPAGTEKPYADEGVSNREGTGSRRLDDLTQALLEGRISEETYREIKSRIEKEDGVSETDPFDSGDDDGLGMR